jgi:hypothetical protein
VPCISAIESCELEGVESLHPYVEVPRARYPFVQSRWPRHVVGPVIARETIVDFIERAPLVMKL